MTRVSVIAPVLNEVDFIGFSILSALPYVHEFVYAIDEASNDGTLELLHHIKDKYAKEKLVILDTPNFNPSDTQAYNTAFNACIEKATGDACWFYHPDMVLTMWNEPQEGPLAWWTNITSYARDFQTVITKGRADKWKNIHAKRFGLTYLGGYGSHDEDFYHKDITGKSLRHFGTDFHKYPFEVKNSGIEVNHYCELKGYKRRLEKMKLCLKTQFPYASNAVLEERAIQHPRVTLEPSSKLFGTFEFEESKNPIPDVITNYKAEFEPFKKEPVYHG